MKRLLIGSVVTALFVGVAAWMNTNHAAPDTQPERLLRHMVIFKFKEDATKEQINAIVEEFGNLPGRIDTIHDYEAGVNNSPEGHNKGFTHCFLVTFKSEEGRATYLPHPAHQAFVTKLRPILDDVMVIDYWTAEE